MATIKERVQRAKQVMDAIVQKYLQNPSAQLLDLKAEGDAELERVGLAQSLQIHPSKTLVHPRNRGTGMLDIPRVPQQVGDISDVAFSWHEVAQACAVRMPPNGSDARRDIEAANANLVIRSGGSLGPVLADDAEVMVTGCNHNSAGLKAINANARCSIPRISEGGFYNEAKIIGRCPSYAKPITDGHRCFVYNWEVEVEWKEYIDCVIEACNVGGAVVAPDNVLQLMTKAHCHAMIQGQLDSELVVAKMMRTKPLLSPMLPQIVQYVEVWCGGRDPHYLRSVADYAQTLDQPMYDNIDGDHLQKINTTPMGHGRGGRYRCGLMKWLVSQAPYPSGVYTKLGKVGPVQDLAFKGEEHMIEFETCVQKLIGKGATVPAKLQGVIGRCDKDIIAYVHSLHKKLIRLASSSPLTLTWPCTPSTRKRKIRSA